MARQRTSTILIRCCAFALLILICAVGVAIYIGASISIHAEKGLHAIKLVTTVVDEYVEREGKWPPSWEDLATHTSARNFGMYSWPE